MTADRKLIACDPADLTAVLDGCEASPYARNTREQSIRRLRADLARAFTAEDVRAEWEQAWDHPPEYWALLLARRLSPPVEHKVTLAWDDVMVTCPCGWYKPLTNPEDPFEPARLAREHLAEQGEDR